MKYTPKVKAIQRECVECGKKFFPGSEFNIYCTVKCRTKANRRKEREEAIKKWNDNPRYCDCCGKIVPFGRRTYCSDDCQIEMKKKMASQRITKKTYKRRESKPPGIETLARDLGMSYGQYRATGGKKPEDIAAKYDAPVYEDEKWIGNKTVVIGQEPQGAAPVARIKRHVK